MTQASVPSVIPLPDLGGHRVPVLALCRIMR